MPPATPAGRVSLRELADLAIGTPEVGAVNFTALHTLIVAVLKNLNLQEALVDFQSLSPEGGRSVESLHSAEPLGASRGALGASQLQPSKEKRKSGSRTSFHALESKVKDLGSQVQDLTQQLKDVDSQMQVVTHVQQITPKTVELDFEAPVVLEVKEKAMRDTEEAQKRLTKVQKEVKKPRHLHQEDAKSLKEAQPKAQELKPQSLQEVLQRVDELEKLVKERDDFLESIGQKMNFLPYGEEVTMVTWEELEQTISDGWKSSQAGSETAVGLSKRKGPSSLTVSDLIPSGVSTKRTSADHIPDSTGGPGQALAKSSASGHLPEGVTIRKRSKGSFVSGREQRASVQDEANTSRFYQPSTLQFRTESDHRRSRERFTSVYPRRDTYTGPAQQDLPLAGDQYQYVHPDQHGGVPMSQGQVYPRPDHDELELSGLDQLGLLYPSTTPPGVVPISASQVGTLPPQMDGQGLVPLGMDQHGLVILGMYQQELIPPGLIQFSADQQGFMQPSLEGSDFIQPGTEQHDLIQPDRDQSALGQPGTYQPGLAQPVGDQHGLAQPGEDQPGLAQPSAGQPGLAQPGAGQRGLAQPGADQHGLVQPGAVQQGLVQPGADQPGLAQPGAYQHGLVQPGADQPGLAQPGADQPGLAQPSADQPGLVQPGAFQRGLAQPGADQPGLAQPGAAQRGLAQSGAGQPGLAQPGADQRGLAQPGADQPGLGQPGADQHGLVQPGEYPPGLVQPGKDQDSLIQPEVGQSGLIQPGTVQQGLMQPGVDQLDVAQHGADQHGLVHPEMGQYDLMQLRAFPSGWVQPGAYLPGWAQPGADSHRLVQPGIGQGGLVQPRAGQHGFVQPGIPQYGLVQPGMDQHDLVQRSADQQGLVQPSADQQGLVQPSAGQQGLVQPSAGQQGLVQPSADQRGLVPPGAEQHGSMQPGADQHDLVPPGEVQHALVQPGMDQHGLLQPGAFQRGLVQPGAFQRGLVQPGASQFGIVQPSMDQHALVQSGADQRGLLQSGADQRGLAQPGAGQFGTVQSGKGQHGLPQAATDQHGLVQPGTDQGALTQPDADQSGLVQPDADQGGLVQPGMDQRGLVQPAVDWCGLAQSGAGPFGMVQPGIGQHVLLQPGADARGLVQPGTYMPSLAQPGAYPPGLAQSGVYPPGLVPPGVYQHSLFQSGISPYGWVQPGAYPRGLVQSGMDRHGLRQPRADQQDTWLRSFPTFQAGSRSFRSPHPYQHGVVPPGQEQYGQVSPLLPRQGLSSPRTDTQGLEPPETDQQGLMHPGSAQLDPDQQGQLYPGAVRPGHVYPIGGQQGPAYPGYGGPGYMGADPHRRVALDPNRILAFPAQTDLGQDATSFRSQDSFGFLQVSSEGSEPRSGAGSERRESVEKLLNFPMAVETLRLMGELISLYVELKGRIKDLDEEKAGQNDLEKIQFLFTPWVKKILPPDLEEQMKILKALTKEVRQEKAKLDKIQRILEGDSEQVTGKELKSGQLGLQLGVLRVTVTDIEKELAELRDSQERGKAAMENSVAEASLYLQDQLDKLRMIIENMLALSSTLLSLSMTPRKPLTTLAPGQIDPEATCPACSLDLSHQVSTLVQRYEQLQEMVSNLAASRPSKKAKLQSQDEELLGHVQSAILQVQGDCEKLNITTSNLIEDHRQKQKDIDVLYQGLEKLEKEKANREHLQMEMDVKADKHALASKVSRVQFDATTEQLNHMMQELMAKMSGQEQDWQKLLDKLLAEMDMKLDRLELDPLKQALEDRWKSLREQLKERSPLYQADEAAAMRRQLLAHFHCLSCDRPLETPVTGQIIPVISVGQALPGHRSTRPYTVFELEQVRQQSRNLKLGSTFPRGDQSSMERSVGRLRTMHSKMLLDIEKVQIHFGGSVRASSQMIRELLQAHCLSSPCYKRVPDCADYTYSTMSRRCGGSHTLTYPYRRNRQQHLPQGLYAPEEIQIAMKHDEVDILGLDGHIYKGRMDTRLPGILTKDKTTKHKPKQSRPRGHTQQPLSDTNQLPFRPQSAQMLAGNNPVSSGQRKDRPVSSEGRLAQSEMAHPPSPDLQGSSLGLEMNMAMSPEEGLEEPTRGPRSGTAQ